MSKLKSWSNSLTGALLAATVSLCVAPTVVADTLTVAVASNFAETMELIVDEFEGAHQHEVRLVRGSSGNHYAQIVNGAPFDLFFSADQARPQALLDGGRVQSNQVKDYAIGQLVLWAPSSTGPDSVRATLETLQFRRLALANPKLAPYGRAAQEVLEALGVMDELVPGQIISGENVAQAHQFVATGNVTLGFVALSQVVDLTSDQYWLIPQQYYTPIVQQVVVLNQSVAAITFMEFFSTPQVQSILQKQGYRLPQTELGKDIK